MSLTQILRTCASSLQAPVVAILLVLAAVTVVILGMLIAEAFTERKRFTAALPKLVDDIADAEDPTAAIEASGLLESQRAALAELLRHPKASPAARESLAVNLVAAEQSRFDNRLRVTDLIAKVAPMLGLMGTLIPLGPGLIAIGDGDVELLSQSLLVAFDTTILGLAIAAVALLISTIRRSWYAKYAAAFDTAAECVLERAAADAEGALDD